VHIASGTHKKSTKLVNAVKVEFGASIPWRACDLFCKTCPSCIRVSVWPTQTSGHCPIISLGFGSRGQVDLINMQSMPDNSLKWLMNYTDHRIKLNHLFALCVKEIRGVAWHLFNLFCFIGPPAILQADNGGEFNGMALNGKARKVMITDEVSRHAICKNTFYFHKLVFLLT
jgi:hypothetical protein